MEFEKLIHQERRGTNCMKWDGMQRSFGDGELEAFWVADMDFHAPECVRSALRNWADTAIYGYYLTPDSYLQSFIDWEKQEHTVEVQREWIRFAPGIVTGLYWAVAALTEPGDAVAVIKPVYYPFFGAVQDTGRRLVSCELHNEGGVYTVDFEALERLFREEQPKVLIMSSPHNPVGRVFRREELEQICALCEQYGILIFSDEIHQDLVYEGYTHIPTMTVKPQGVVTFASASKTFNLAGLQNSFIVIPDAELRERFDSYMKAHVAVHGGCVAGDLAAEAAFRGGKPWLNSVRKLVRENFTAIRDILRQKAPKAIVTELEGTYLMWIDLRAYLTEQERIKELVQDRCRLAVDFGDWFGGDAFVGFIRINLATDPERCIRAAERLGDALASL